MEIYLRPLKKEDGNISYKWRNDSIIWKYTGSKPDRIITPDIECKWVEDVLVRKDEIRFAICIKGTNEYIGNVQLTKIKDDSAEFHIFIGEKKYWGRGIGQLATKKLLDFAFYSIGIKRIFLSVNKENKSAINTYGKCGFNYICDKNNQVYMEISWKDIKC